jgi:hypothetical protein
MLKGLKALGIAAAAVMLMASSANAATVIDFTGGVGFGGSITWDGTNYIGSNIPINAVSISGANIPDNTFAVTGSATATTPGSYGSLSFDTHSGTNFISISGCIEALGIGGMTGGVCTSPVTLMSGTFRSWDTNNNHGLTDATGLDTKAPELLQAIGYTADFPWEFYGFSTRTVSPLTVGVAGTVNSTDVGNTPVPEPATMMLLGTGLLAAFRARRRQA